MDPRGSVVTLPSTRIEGLPLVHRGKVRETYAVGDDRLLLVATDRLSAFDVVFDQPIPDKGRVLTQLSAWWFERARRPGPHPTSSPPIGDRRPEAARARARRPLDARAPRRADRRGVRRARLPGRLGLGRVPAQRSGRAGTRCRTGCARPIGLPEPIFTPSTKAEVGHDENITRGTAGRDGRRRAGAPARGAIARAVRRGRAARRTVGLILADTKFEFGWIDGELAVIDEVLTPDSWRFWDADRYEPGSSPPSFDKQFVRDFVAASGWNKEPPAPRCPDDVIAGTRDRYVAAYERLTGGLAAAGGHRPMRWLAEVHVRLRPGIADPEGQTIAGGLRSLGYASVSEVRSGKLLRIAFEADDHAAAEEAVAEMCRRLLANPVMETAELGAARRRASPSAMRRTIVERRPAVAVVVFPGTWSERDFAHVRRQCSAGRRAWSGTPRPISAPPMRWSCPAASPTATTCAPARSPGSRRSCARSRRSPMPAAGHRLLQRLPDPDRGRDAAGRPHAQRPPRVPVRLAVAARRAADRRGSASWPPGEVDPHADHPRRGPLLRRPDDARRARGAGRVVLRYADADGR